MSEDRATTRLDLLVPVGDAPLMNRANLRDVLSLALAACSALSCQSTSCISAAPHERSTMTETSLIRLPGAEPFGTDLSAALREALAEQGPKYQPRTHHWSPSGEPKYINRLIFETSPYLLQHAHNPVNWRPWGDEAFDAARKLGRPVLLSVGYSTCHWCHVMERESFEDEEIAEFINRHYVAIKVDREERPDVDSVYMTALQIMTRRGGGWPMTVFMTPDGEPYFAGTYFAPRDGDRDMPIGFLSVLRRLHEAYVKEPDRIAAATGDLSRMLHQATQRRPPEGFPSPDIFHEAAQYLARQFDQEAGGFGRAPKFPRPSTYELLLRYWRRSGDERALHVVSHSLRKMMRGGIYDHLAGGFARYSTDRQWLVPHFEKMLYDNAQLVVLLIETYQATQDPDFAEVARETLDYVLREMTSTDGGFYSATDADSEGEEGKFFVWTPAEIRAVVGESRARAVLAYFAVTDSGNFEGRNILHRPRIDAEVASELEVSVDALRAEIAAAKPLLYAARQRRVPPLLDDKVITEWNGQMISAFARAGFVLDEPRYVQAAERAADFVLTKLTADGRLLRAYRNGRARHRAVLEDYAFVIAALLDVFEATSAARWLDEAVRLQAVLDEHYRDASDGAYFATADDGPKLLVREKPVSDGAQPSGNSVTALNLLRLHTLTTEEKYRKAAEMILFAFGRPLTDDPFETPKLVTALDFYHDEAKEIALVGDGPARADLEAALRTAFVPNRAIVRRGPIERVPWSIDKRAIGGQPTAYVCLQQICNRPTSDPVELTRQLSEVQPISAPPLVFKTTPVPAASDPH